MAAPFAFFIVVGLDALRAFWYRPHALHIVAPWGDLLHKGVLVVPQLLVGVNIYSTQKDDRFSPADLPIGNAIRVNDRLRRV